MSTWSVTDLPAQSGRTIIVTGANSGLGRATTAALAGAGARVVMAVRDVSRGEQAAASIAGNTEVRELDLADLASVRRFAAEWSEPIDVLVNNAGVMAVREGLTKDGFELQFGTNHLGHFALTNLLGSGWRRGSHTARSRAAPGCRKGSPSRPVGSQLSAKEPQRLEQAIAVEIRLSGLELDDVLPAHPELVG
jgi:NAD(P)-dependent dehydrogenase (short-subunit alcohol dehydrogenase family)